MNRMFPETGRPRDELEREMAAARENDVDWRSGRSHRTAYYVNDEVYDVVRHAYSMFLNENGLYPAQFRSIARFESEVLRMTAEILRGDADVAGICTAGGTESILLAVKSARDHARVHRPQAREPEILLSRSAHPAFNKAAHVLGLNVVRVPLGEDLRADVPAMAERVSDNTILIVGSAPPWPFGIIDPIDEIAALAESHGIWMHVDSCVGGFIAPFARELGYPVPDFDFTVPGVCSISADIHKYGYAAKNVSTLSFRNEGLRECARFEFDDWPAGRYSTYTYLGSRTGGSIAGAWAVMNHLGRAGYLDATRRAMATRDRLIAGIRAIPGLEIRGEPHLAGFAFGASDCDIFLAADALESRGWTLYRDREPPSIQLMATPIHGPLVDEFLGDLEAALGEARAKAGAAVVGEVSYAE